VTLERREHDDGTVRVRTTECAVCGEVPDPDEQFWRHVWNHQPADLGLEPAREGQRGLAAFDDGGASA
jgi:hypothetical protein